MTERASAVVASTMGAVIGAVIGYLLFTNQGRLLRRRLEPALEDLFSELNHFRSTVQKAAEVATEGWNLLNDTLSEGHKTPPIPRYSDPHQTTPF